MPKKTDWSRSLTVYCDTPDQKAELARLAKDAGRSTSRHILTMMLNGAHSKELKDDAANLRADAERLRGDVQQANNLVLRGNEELEAEKRRYRDLERQHAEVLRQLNEAKVTLSRNDREYNFIDARVLDLISEHKENGVNVPLLEHDIIHRLDKTTDHAFQNSFWARMEQLVKFRVVDRVDIRGRTAYIWRVRP